MGPGFKCNRARERSKKLKHTFLGAVCSLPGSRECKKDKGEHGVGSNESKQPRATSTYLLLGRLLGSSDRLLLLGSLLGFGRYLVGVLDLDQSASLNAPLESSLENVLLDHSLETKWRTGIVEVYS